MAGETFQETGLKIVLLGVREYERNAKNIERSITNMNRSITTSGTAAKNASGSVSKYSEHIGQASTFSSKLTSASTSLSAVVVGLGQKFTTLGTILTAGVSLPLLALEKRMINTGISFEDAFANVSKTVDGISDDFGNLTEGGEEFRKSLIGLSLNLPVSVDTLAQVAAAGGQVGVAFGENGEILLEFTKIAAQMSVATNITAEESAIAMARVANIYGVASEDMIEFSRGFSSAIVGLGNTTAASEQEILNMTMRLAPAGNLAGLTTSQVLALAASMTEMGIQAEAGGTAMSTLLLTMTEASKSAGAGQDAFNESNKQMESGLNRLRDLINSGVTDLTELEFALQGTGLNLEGVGSLLDDLGSQNGSVASLNSQIERNTNTIDKYKREMKEVEAESAKLHADFAAGLITQEQLDKKTQTLTNRYENLKYSLENAQISADDYTRKMGELHDETVTTDDIIRHVSMKTMLDMNEAMEEASTKVGIFADILGVSEKQFADSFGADPLGTMQRFLSQLADLQDQGKVTEATLTELGFSGIRVRSVINVLGPNMESLTENVNLSNTAWVEQTALQVEVQKKFATTKAKIDLMKNAFNALSIAVFDRLKPSIDKTLETMTKAIKVFTNFFNASDKNAQMVIKLTTALIAVGPALAGIGLALRLMGTGLSKLNLDSFFTPLFKLLANPLLFAGLGGIALAFVAIKKNVFGLGDVFSQLSSSLSNLFGVFSKLGDFAKLGPMGPAFMGGLKSLLSGDIKSAFAYAKIVLSEFIRFIKTYFLPVLKQEWAKMKVMIMDSVRAATRWIKTDGVELFNTAVDTVVQETKNAFHKLPVEIQDALRWGRDTFNSIQESLSEIVSQVQTWIETEGIPAIEGALDTLGTELSDLKKYIKTHTVLESLSYIAGLIAGSLAAVALVIGDALLDVTLDVGRWIIDQVESIDFTKISDTIKDVLFPAFKEGFSKAFEKVITELGGEDLYEDLVDVFESDEVQFVIDQLSNVLDDVVDGVSRFVKEIGKIDPSSILKILLPIVLFVGALATIGIDAIALALPGLGIGIRVIVDALGDLASLKFEDAFNTLLYGLVDLLSLDPEKAVIGLVAIVAAIKLVLIPVILSLAATINTFITASLIPLIASLSAVLAPLLLIAAPFAIVVGLIYAYTNNVWGLRDAIDGFREKAKAWIGIWENFKTILKELWERFKGMDLIQSGSDLITGFWDGLKSVWNSVWNWITGTIQGFIDWIKEKLGISSPSTVFFEIGVDVLNGLWDGIKKFWEAFKDWVGSKFNELITSVKEKLGLGGSFNIFDVGKEFINKIWEGMLSLWESYIAWVQQKAASIVTTFTNIMGDILNFGKNLVTSIQGGIQAMWGMFIIWIGSKVTEIKNAFSGLVTSALQIGRDIISNLKQGILDKWNDFTETVTGLFESIPYLGEVIGKIFSPSKVMADIGENYVAGLQVGWARAIPNMMKTVQSTFSGITVGASLSTKALSDHMMDAALGKTVTNTSYSTVNNQRSSVFSPTINAVPMQNEQQMGDELLRTWRMAQAVNNV